MAKIILKDGTEEYLSPGAAQAKVTAGEAVWAQGVPMYSTRQIVAEPVKTPKKRKPRTPKVEKPKVEEPKVEEPEIKELEAEQVEADEAE